MAGCWDIQIDQGSSFAWTITYQDENGDSIDISAWTSKMDVRIGFKDSELIFSLTPGSGIDDSDANIGILRFNFTKTQTALLVEPLYRYDVELTSNADAEEVTRILEGQIETSLEVTD